MAVAADVPGKFDVIINSQGYRLLDSMQPSLAFRIHRAEYGYSPTFVERSNVSGDYGDSQQDFWLTVSDRDWSLGEQQFYYRQDEVGSKRYYRGTALDVTVPGQVTTRYATTAVSFGSDAIRCGVGGVYDINSAPNIVTIGTTNLYLVDGSGTATSKGAHGLGAAPTPFGIARDKQAVYFTTMAAGTVGVRKYDGVNFTTFSATPADSLCYLNNTLYGLDGNAGRLIRYDTAGVATELYKWKGADGGTLTALLPLKMISYGGRVLMLFRASSQATGAELWQYDGVGVSQLAILPAGFLAWDMDRYGDVVVITGNRLKALGAATTFYRRPAAYAYVSGSVSLIWEAEDWLSATENTIGTATTGGPGVATFSGGCVFHDHYRDVIVYYDLVTGGISTIAPGTGASQPMPGSAIISGPTFFLLIPNTKTSTVSSVLYPASAKATAGTLTTSLFDFDSSLPKYFKAVMIDADIPTGATIDIAYFTNTIPYSSTTDVRTGAVAGTEYTIGTTARSIGFLVTLNKGSSTAGPTLKRIYVRAAPMLQTFRRAQYYLDCSGRKGDQMLKLRDDSTHSKDGKEMANDLITAATAASPFSITDRFGTFTGIIEPDQFNLREIRPDEFAAQVTVRQV